MGPPQRARGAGPLTSHPHPSPGDGAHGGRQHHSGRCGMGAHGWWAARGWLISLITLAMPVAFADTVDLQLGLDAQPLANPTGGRSRSGTWMQQLNFRVTAGSGLNQPPQRWREQDHWRTRLELSLFSGADDLNERIGAAFPLQSVPTHQACGSRKRAWSGRAGRAGSASRPGCSRSIPLSWRRRS